MKIVLLGPIGVGKGTQAQKLRDEYAVIHISTGDMLREHVRNNTEIGQRVKSIMDSGALVPDEIIVEMVKQRVKEPDAAKGFILDGFPRNTNQAEILEKENILGDDYRAVLLDLADDAIIKRLGGRRVCPACSAVFHTISLPPKKDGLCDTCGAKLIQRDDDKEDVVMKRLGIYHETSEPVKDFYSARNRLTVIDSGSCKSADDVTDKIKAALSRA